MPIRLTTAMLSVLLVTAGALAAPITYQDSVRKNPNLRLFAAKIDLTAPGLQISVAAGGPDPDGGGPWETVLRQPSELAQDHDFDLTVNSVFFTHHLRDGDPHHYFAGDPARSAGLVMIDGKIVSSVHTGAALVIDDQNRASIGTIAKTIPPGARQIVSGSGQIVLRGKNVGGGDPPAPRTAAGVTADGKTLVLLVVDGRRPEWSAGLTQKQLADEMIALGCSDAINLDSGGSSTMVRKSVDGKYRVVNTPSDGSTLFLPLSVERPVPYVLGIRIKAK